MMSAQPSPLESTALQSTYLINTELYFNDLLSQLSAEERDGITQEAMSLARAFSTSSHTTSDFEQLMAALPLETERGRSLFYLAESFLRTRHTGTRKQLIEDAFDPAVWNEPLGAEKTSLLVRTALFLSHVVSQMTHTSDGKPIKSKGMLENLKQYVLHNGLEKVLSHLAHHFVAAESIEDAVESVQHQVVSGYLHSFDMLGEAATTFAQAEQFYSQYESAIDQLGAAGRGCFKNTPEISIKISALDPCYFPDKYTQCKPRLLKKLETLCKKAVDTGVAVTLDAEESFRLEMQLDLLAHLLKTPSISPAGELGLAVQAYQKRATATLAYLEELCDQTQSKLHVRLVKGAYWDTEIRLAQKAGIPDYPVFTRKHETDLNYFLCAKALLLSPRLTGQFASHNLISLAGVRSLSKQLGNANFEIQKLYGMGDAIHQLLSTQYEQPIRIYTPIGQYDTLLPYLVRRLLENGVNSSFLNLYQSGDFTASVSEELVLTFERYTASPSQRGQLPLPKEIYHPQRKNSEGEHVDAFCHQAQWYSQLCEETTALYHNNPVIHSRLGTLPAQPSEPVERFSPVASELKLGTVHQVTALDHEALVQAAEKGHAELNELSVKGRVAIIKRFVELLNREKARLLALIVAETGKNVRSALDEIRELEDYCHYYAHQAKILLGDQPLKAPAGELNRLTLVPRGISLCISPWNFPAAIFGGQIIAAWLTGNAVIAKPSSETPLTAHFLHQLLIDSGTPPDSLHLLMAPSRLIAPMLKHPSIATVVFTGSWNAARNINQTLADRNDQICPFIAETGGLNAMICDSSALSEQVIGDVLRSAFDSAGQRCSALRLLAVPAQLVDFYQNQLVAAMKTLTCSTPYLPETDCGPVINQKQFSELSAYLKALKQEQVLFQLKVHPSDSNAAWFSPELYLGPTLVRINALDELKEELFGPILHIMPYDESNAEGWLNELNNKGFGLTFGIHSRSPSRIESLSRAVRAGNVYINQAIIGATVGSQPFGGVGLSGTGPKAGGPHYLTRFCYEKTLSHNEAASGGNPALFNQNDR